MTRRNFIARLAAVAAVMSGSRGYAHAALPKVLILGDSISIGYTPYVREMLKGKAEVMRPDENCQGTTHGLKNLEKWLGETRWDVIHFNFGLHDMKHVDPVTGKNSNDPAHPQQAGLKQYKRNLQTITDRLKRTGAALIFATTTPFPEKTDGPLRHADQPEAYNRVALRIMEKHHVTINDLHAFVLPQMSAIQIPNNVHFTDDGSRVLATKVSDAITTVLAG